MAVKNVVLSGGVGSRLWPLSRKSRPKQYIPLFDGRSLFELTVERNASICDETLVVGNRENYLLSRASLSKLGRSSSVEIIEATPRNTAAAIAFAALASEPEDILLVTPSDHLISDDSKYQERVNEAISLANQGYLVTFGIKPTKPETGYGYIEYSKSDVISFREKPDKESAQQFIASGNFLWNSGIFCFSAGTFLEQLQKYSLEIFSKSQVAWSKLDENFLPLEESLSIPSLSVDYAVMEKSKLIKVVPSEFGWSDLGSFDAIWELCDKSRDKYYFCDSNLVLGTSKKVEVIGIKDSIIVETDDALLVVHKDSSQEVKKIYENLERVNPSLT